MDMSWITFDKARRLAGPSPMAGHFLKKALLVRRQMKRPRFVWTGAYPAAGVHPARAANSFLTA
jgi:hypothetical protein